MKLWVATSNPGKIIEIKSILTANCSVFSLLDLDNELKINETGASYKENALLKARSLKKIVDAQHVIADDSGLEVDFLEGKPGIYSARFAGKNACDQANIKKLLKKLEGLKPAQRTARFVCTIAYISPDDQINYFTGKVEGIIADKPQGKNGFGYDPVFYLPERDCTFACLTSQEKNKISHRRNALNSFNAYLNKKIIIS